VGPGGVSAEVTEADAEALARRLDSLIQELGPRERALLGVVMARAMTPIERLRYLDAPGMLTAEERRLLGGAG
jgi:hypothetical protein